MALSIRGIGTALPEFTLSPDETASMSNDLICRDRRETRLVGAMLRHAQVNNRHTCVPHEIAYRWFAEGAEPGSSPGPTTQERMEMYAAHAGPLAEISARRCLQNAETSPSDVSHLVTVSCTGFEAPGVDVQLIEQLPLPPTTQRVHVGYMGCHAAFNALRVVHGLAAADPSSRVLLVATELCSLHFRFQWDDDSILANALFADGSAAVLVRADTPSDGNLTLAATGSCLLPESKDAMTWNIGNHGFEMTLSSRIPDLISQHLLPWLDDWLAEHGLDRSEVGAWAVHPGGPKILDAVESTLKLEADALAESRRVLSELGNMSSPTILFVLQRLMAAEARRPIVALGFGPGLMVEAAIFR